ncbi:outer membrane beta-barrel protein [Flavobacterium psychrotolerans]|uniref:Porin n=1 Tax=Flavobacterium psychrotolerans TaxID=2169410 RepID=A0A2U1JJZ0_9FLAO|nr:outer membrane beta-barrel protein [Flavobacterium psychrotolerans]PWA05325.1 porin [Flavobacterium psychrotolerans]
MKKTVLILALMLTASMTFAQDAAVTPSATTFAGSADMYYKVDFSQQQGNGKTSFTNSHNSFELGMASIEASHKSGKASVFVDLGFGKRAKDFSYNDGANTFMIKQLTFAYDISSSFKVTMGTFGTHIGYELLDAVDNKNYSMSYAFTNGPFFNTGVKAQYTKGKFSFMAGVTNPTDFKTAIEAGSTQKTFIGQVAYVGDTESLYFNVTTGSTNPNLGLPSSLKNKTQFDVVASKKLDAKLSLGFNGTYAIVNDDVDSSLDGKWFALVGYASYVVKEDINLAYRLEYFSDKDKVVYGVDGLGVIANTLSLNYKVGNLTIIPELRVDTTSKDFFTNHSGNPTGLNAFALLATTYTF